MSLAWIPASNGLRDGSDLGLIPNVEWEVVELGCRVVGSRVEGGVFIMKRVCERMLDGTLGDSEEVAGLF